MATAQTLVNRPNTILYCGQLLTPQQYRNLDLR
jgi:hypothetical protein